MAADKKIVTVDSNILLSALIWGGKPLELLNALELRISGW